MDYLEQLAAQRVNSLKEPVFSCVSMLYNEIAKELNINGKYLEIGSGAGVSIDFLGEANILRTEFMESAFEGVCGNIDAHDLPYEGNEFDGVILFDSFHHLANPIKAMNEFLRVMKPGGKIILMEPYVSFLSYPVYKMFHFEDTSWNYKFRDESAISKNPGEGDQGISRGLIGLLGNKNHETLNAISGWSCKYIAPFSFFLTGGTTSPFRIPKLIIRTVILFERLIPKRVMKFIAARVLIVISK